MLLRHDGVVDEHHTPADEHPLSERGDLSCIAPPYPPGQKIAAMPNDATTPRNKTAKPTLRIMGSKSPVVPQMAVPNSEAPFKNSPPATTNTHSIIAPPRRSLARPERQDVGWSRLWRPAVQTGTPCWRWSVRDVSPLAERPADATAGPGAGYDPLAHSGRYQGRHVTSRCPLTAGTPNRERGTGLEVVAKGAEDGRVRGHGRSMIADRAQRVSSNICRVCYGMGDSGHPWRQLPGDP